MPSPDGADALPDKAPETFVDLARQFGLWSAVLAVGVLILLWRSPAILDVLRLWHQDGHQRALNRERWDHEKEEKDTRLLADLRMTQARLHMTVDNDSGALEQGDGHDE